MGGGRVRWWWWEWGVGVGVEGGVGVGWGGGLTLNQPLKETVALQGELQSHMRGCSRAGLGSVAGVEEGGGEGGGGRVGVEGRVMGWAGMGNGAVFQEQAASERADVRGHGLLRQPFVPLVG